MRQKRGSEVTDKAELGLTAREVFDWQEVYCGVQQTPCVRSKFLTFLRFKRLSVLVAAIAVDLAANLATGPKRTMNVYVGSAGADSPDYFIKFSGGDSLCGSRIDHVGGRN